MGLDIQYGKLHDYLIRMYSDTSDIDELVRLAEDKISEQIRMQIGSQPLLHQKGTTEHLKGVKYGNYSEIHFLRMFAARISGYTLEEAYEIEIPAIKLNSEFPEDDALEENEDACSTESEFEEIWGVPIDKVMPVRNRDTNAEFPFYNLVCFSDAEGIYIPIEFRKPIELDDITIGSSLRLREELELIESESQAMLIQAMKDREIILEEYLQYVRRLWWRLYEPCSLSINNNVSLLFT
jgi:hypothetical protein